VIHYERDDERQRILVRAEGPPSLEETLAVISRQAAEGAWSYAVIYDSRGASRGPSSDEVLEVIRLVGRLTAKHGPRGPVAVVISNPDFFRAAKRYASLGELTALEVELFATTEAAESWLQQVKHS
jgi:hypothetical protein